MVRPPRTSRYINIKACPQRPRLDVSLLTSYYNNTDVKLGGLLTGTYTSRRLEILVEDVLSANMFSSFLT